MLFLGIYDSSISAFSQSDIDELKVAISRLPDENRNVTSQPHFALVTIDFEDQKGAFSLQEDDERIGLVVGRPYLDLDNKLSDSAKLIEALKTNDTKCLSATRGSFCGLSFNKKTTSLLLCTDKVGVYPIYIASVGSRVYFSNALRMLRSISIIAQQLAPDRLFPNLAFGYCLDRDTVFADIDRMYGGEIVEINKIGVNHKKYWHWDQVEPSNYSESDLEERVYQSFINAVNIRLDSAPGDLSFLSGGLDSRCIVAALRNLGRKVWTLNFAPEGSQDHLFGRLAAEALGSTHFEMGVGRDSFSKRQKKILDSWADANGNWIAQGANANRVWSGDGGSVGLGHVYLDEKFIQLLREKNIKGACEYLIEVEKLKIPVGMLIPDLREEARNNPLEKMYLEIQQFSTKDPAKSGLLFFLLNDQRHHLADYFENLDLYRFEVVLPFFDSNFLELIVAAPIDNFLRHAFYNKWLEKFGPEISIVPWQAYPGHVPCPLSTEDYGKLRYQWNEGWLSKEEEDQRLLENIDSWKMLLRHKQFPTKILSKYKLRIAFWLTKLKILDYSYVLDAAKKILFFNERQKK